MIKKQHMTVLAGVFSLAILGAPQAHADWVHQEHVTAEVTQVGGSYQYTFVVYNDSYGNGNESSYTTPLLIGFELPYFADMGITNITAPNAWSYEIAQIGVPNPDTGWTGVASWMTDPAWSSGPFAGVTEVIHWYGCVVIGEDCWNGGFVSPGNYLTHDGVIHEGSPFGFTADYAPADAPYQTSWYLAPPMIGTPLMPMMPGSPCALGQCGDNNGSNVPEPGSLALASAALLAAVGIRRRNKRVS